MPRLDKDILDTLKKNTQPVAVEKEEEGKEVGQGIESQLGLGLEQEQEAAPKAPASPVDRIQSYKDALEKMEIPGDEAHKIIDALIFDGQYIETFSIKDRIQFRLRTRSAKDLEDIQGSLREVKNGAEYVDKLNRANLVRSLVSYGDRVFENPKQVSEFLDTLSVHVYGHIVNQLARFDLKMDVVLSEGALENF